MELPPVMNSFVPTALPLLLLFLLQLIGHSLDLLFSFILGVSLSVHSLLHDLCFLDLFEEFSSHLLNLKVEVIHWKFAETNGFSLVILFLPVQLYSFFCFPHDSLIDMSLVRIRELLVGSVDDVKCVFGFNMAVSIWMHFP
jgi:hypothetical protein